MNITVEVQGEERLNKALRGVAADLSDLTPAWRAVSDEIYSIERRQFSTQGARGPAGKWEKRADSTVARYTAINRRGFAVLNETLRRTDATFKALTTRGAPGGIYDPQPSSLTVGTDLKSPKGFPYPKAHQTGAPRANIRQRKLYDLTDRDAARLLSILKRGLVGKVKDRGFDYVEDFGEAAF